jgi:hypothetical protein
MIGDMLRLTTLTDGNTSDAATRWKDWIHGIGRFFGENSEHPATDLDPSFHPIFCCGIGRPVYVHPPGTLRGSADQ